MLSALKILSMRVLKSLFDALIVGRARNAKIGLRIETISLQEELEDSIVEKLISRLQ